MSQKVKSGISGALAGAANGFFGAGGGMLLVPLLTSWIRLPQQKAFATSVAIILPLSAVSACVYIFRGDLNFMTALPYLIGGLIGGFLGGKVFKKIPVVWLRRALGLLIIYGGVRCFI